ncbi:interleukin-15 receptor subunit alpha isoform X1 [Callorhinchus milii]|uniref:interleukin-15 receptor subunit alpha isoform X1 n=1 Tax=Callorhinchus milii TaxID=7868 RepID=UPI0004574DD2|nr:interleukin-15 receptor subunit alpha isoform X1 [Callorhinchus milii]|eukprot:gi/632947371/ref/XP_007889015.1/ PREDICTED: interleukin-15 receptor subunit alpha isoform X1 [Callorhinchus milii]
MALLIALQPLLLLLLWIFPSQATDSVLSGSCGRPDLNVPNVNMSVITKNSFKVGDRLRLTCDNGYVRKAGTSNLIHCEANQFQWSKPNLTCIRLSGHPPLTTTPTTEAPKAVTPTDNDTTAKTTITTAESTTPPISTTLSDLHRTPTTDLTGTTGSHRLAPEATLAARSVETTTAATDTVTTHSDQPRTTATDNTGTSGPGPLLSTRTAVRSTTTSPTTAETEFATTVLSEGTQTATAETTVTYSANLTTENASPMYNIKVKAVAGGSAAVIIVIGGGLFLLWLFVVKRKVCRLTSRASKYEMEPVEPNSPESGTVAEVELVNETKALQSGEHRDSEMIQTRQVHPLLGWCGGSA